MCEYFISKEKKLNEISFYCMNNEQLFSRVIASMLNDVVKEIDAIYDLSGFTATLDIILALATV